MKTTINNSVIAFLLLTAIGTLLATLTPLLGAKVWIIGLGAITFGRILLLSGNEIPDKHIIRITLASWAFFAAGIMIPKIVLVLAGSLNHVDGYLLIFTTIFVGALLANEAYRTSNTSGIHLTTILFYAGNYILFATITNLIAFGILYIISAGNIHADFTNTISYAALYKSGADILVIQTSCLFAHVVTLKLYKSYKEKFESVPLYA